MGQNQFNEADHVERVKHSCQAEISAETQLPHAKMLPSRRQIHRVLHPGRRSKHHFVTATRNCCRNLKNSWQFFKDWGTKLLRSQLCNWPALLNLGRWTQATPQNPSDRPAKEFQSKTAQGDMYDPTQIFTWSNGGTVFLTKDASERYFCMRNLSGPPCGTTMEVNLRHPGTMEWREKMRQGSNQIRTCPILPLQPQQPLSYAFDVRRFLLINFALLDGLTPSSGGPLPPAMQAQ